MSTASDAEYYAALEETDIRLRVLHGDRTRGPCARVEGVWEAVTFVTFETGGGLPPTYLRGPTGKQLGTGRSFRPATRS